MMELDEKGKKRKNDYKNYYDIMCKETNFSQKKNNFFHNFFYRNEENNINNIPLMKYHIYLEVIFQILHMFHII